MYEIHNPDGKQTSTNKIFYKSKQYSTQKTAIIFPERKKEYCLITSGEWDKEGSNKRALMCFSDSDWFK